MNAQCLASLRAARISASSRSSSGRIVGSIVSSDLAGHRSTNAAASATAASSRSFITSSLGANGVRSQRTPCTPDSTAVVTARSLSGGGSRHCLVGIRTEKPPRGDCRRPWMYRPLADSAARNGHTQPVAREHSPRADEKAASRPPEKKREGGFRELRHYVPAEILDVSFPIAVRGYERRAVDEHITRVNRVIAELKVSASPPAAVRHALDVAGE